jgi:hypothetical protein
MEHVLLAELAQRDLSSCIAILPKGGVFFAKKGDNFLQNPHSFGHRNCVGAVRVHLPRADLVSF